MWLQPSWPVRARTPLLPLPTDYSANAIHTFAPNNMPGCQRQRSCAEKFTRTAGNDFREMEDSTRCGRARSSKETREPSSNATNIGNHCQN